MGPCFVDWSHIRSCMLFVSHTQIYGFKAIVQKEKLSKKKKT